MKFTLSNRTTILAAMLIATAGLALPAVLADGHGHAAPAKPAAKTPAPAAKPAAAPATHADHAEPKAPGVETKPNAASTKTDPKAAKPAEGKAADKAEKNAEPKVIEPKPSEPKRGMMDMDSPTDPDACLAKLVEGNQRWVDGNTNDPNTSLERRANVADAGQKPFVTILTCADSRLPVERIFDRGVGDVFVVRVAGNVSGSSEVGTIEYGVEHLKTPLLVIMGHTKCGAVAAAASGAEVHGSVKGLIDHVMPAVERVKRNNPNADAKELAALVVRENVWQSTFDLFKSSPEIRTMVEEGKLKVVGAVCDINTGKVTWLGQHPWQGELIDAMKAREIKKDQAANADPKHGE